MKRFIIASFSFITFIIFISSSTVNAQRMPEYLSSLGATTMVAMYSDGEFGFTPALTYGARYNFKKLSETTSLSLNSRISLGGILQVNDYGSGFAYGFEIPATVDYNFGFGTFSKDIKKKKKSRRKKSSRRSSKRSKSTPSMGFADLNFGGYVGAGLALNYINTSNYEGGHFVTGLTVNTGLRYGNTDRNGGFGLYGILGFNSDLVLGLRYVYTYM